DAALAVLADTRLKARTWQQDTDFQGGVLGAYNIEGGDSGDSACAQACSHGASGKSLAVRIRVFPAHWGCFPGRLMHVNGMMRDIRSNQQAGTATNLCCN